MQARERRRGPGPEGRSYLICVHFEFADHFDSYFALCLGIPSSIDIAEGTVSHLLHEDVSFETRVFGQFALLFSFFIDYLL